MAFSLPPLPYAPDALEPHIDKATMEIHHGKHHNAYVTNLNKALESARIWRIKSLEDLLANNLATVPENIRTAVRNNGGGHYNHSMFWQIMGPNGGGQPSGETSRTAITGVVWQLRRLQREVQRRRNDAVRLGLGVAGEGLGQQRGSDFDCQPGQSGDGRAIPDHGLGRLGARLLSEVSESAAGLHLSMVERRELDGSESPLTRR